jgi:hypothetical protein
MGNANRNPLYGPGINYGDTAIEKNIYLSGEGESRYIQLGFETFNTFNHANFASPGTPGFGAGGCGELRRKHPWPILQGQPVDHEWIRPCGSAGGQILLLGPPKLEG